MANNEQKLDEPALWLPSNLDINGDPLPGEPQYTPRVDRRLIEALITDGVFDRLGGHLSVRQRAAGANMSVEIDPGFAGVLADGQAYAGRYLAVANAVQTLQIDDAPASGARIDLIVVRVHDSSVSGTRNEAVFEAVKGTTVTAGNPTVPALPASSLPLAQILVSDLVAGQPRVSITDADITDQRTQARVPLGVTVAGPTSVYNEALGPVGWPDGVTTMDVVRSDGWPVDGILVTTKHYNPVDDKQRVVQQLTSGFGEVPFIYRKANNNPTGPQWSGWNATPSPVRENIDGGLLTRTPSAWSNSPQQLPQLLDFRTGPNGYADVHIGARIQGLGTAPSALMSFDVRRTSDGGLILPADEIRSVGYGGGSTSPRLYIGRSFRATLNPFTEYDFIAQYQTGGSSAEFAQRTIKVQTS